MTGNENGGSTLLPHYEISKEDTEDRLDLLPTQALAFSNTKQPRLVKTTTLVTLAVKPNSEPGLFTIRSHAFLFRKSLNMIPVTVLRRNMKMSVTDLAGRICQFIDTKREGSPIVLRLALF